jgi:hypothetical protein
VNDFKSTWEARGFNPQPDPPSPEKTKVAAAVQS